MDYYCGKKKRLNMVVLVNLKFEHYKITNFRRQEHLGLGYIAANAEKHGHKVEVINAQFENIETDKVIKRIQNMELPKVLGVSLYEMQLQETIDFINKIKEIYPSIITVVGGHFATFNASEILEKVPTIDIVICGEGEISFANFLDEVYQGKTEFVTKGVCYRKNGKNICNGISEYVKDLDSLPYPKRSKIDRGDLITNISAGRGCHGDCSFCSTNAFDKKQKVHGIRIRNPIKVVDEVEFLIKNYNAYHLFFTDDNFLVTERIVPGWIDKFTTEIKKRNLKMIFNFDCRVDDIRVEDFKKLKEIGLIGIFLGVESNSENTLKLYNKGTSQKKNIEAIKLLRKLRIDYWIGNIMFHPLTTIEDIEADTAFFDEINYVLYFNYTNPISLLAGKLFVYKGTPIYELFAKEGLIRSSGLSVQYEFKYKSVSSFYDFISRWGKVIEPFVELDTIHLLEIANKLNLLKIAGDLHSISRKYMRLDFEVFKTALENFKKNPKLNSAEYFEQIYAERMMEVKGLYADLLNIRSQLQ